MKLGISTLVDLDVPLEALLKLIACAGFTHVSFGHDVEHAGYHLPSRRREIRELLKQLGLRLNYIHAPLYRFYDLTSLDPQVRRASIEVMKMCADACAEIEGDGLVVHIMNGPLGAGERIEDRVAAGLESLEELHNYTLARGVRISAENLPLHLECGIVSLAVLRAAMHAGIGICLDTCHANMHTQSGLELVQELAPRVWHTHVSDTHGDHDSHLIPGEGAIDFPAIAQCLGQSGFKGVVDLECSLWMLRYRWRRGELQPGDPDAADVAWITTEQYLAQAAQAGWRLVEWIAQAGK